MYFGNNFNKKDWLPSQLNRNFFPQLWHISFEDFLGGYTEISNIQWWKCKQSQKANDK